MTNRDLEKAAELRSRMQQIRRDYEQLLRDMHIPDLMIMRAGKTAEAICKLVYQREGLDRGARPADRMELEPLITALGRRDLPPRFVRPHVRTIQAWRNFVGHDQGRQSGALDDDTVQTVESALTSLVNWFFNDYLADEELPFAPTPSERTVAASSDDDGALAAYREALWWLRRRGALRPLDVLALRRRRAELGVDEAAAHSLEASCRRDEQTFRGYLRDAFAEGEIDAFEVDGLEEARLDCCISEREATSLAAAERGGLAVSVAADATAPEWLTASLAAGSAATVPMGPDEAAGHLAARAVALGWDADRPTASVGPSPFDTAGYVLRGRDGKAALYCHASGRNRGLTCLVRGGIGWCYQTHLGGPGGFLGLPVRDERLMEHGARSDFEGGWVDWHRDGSVIRAWRRGAGAGAEASLEFERRV